jgi:adenylylsulfate kinase
VSNPDAHTSETSGATIWFTGLPSSGKSTLAAALAARLAAEGHRTQVIDGDVLRAALWPDLGFTRADRQANVLRIEFIAQLLTQHGVKVIVACIAPYLDVRAQVRKRHEDNGATYVEVHVSTPLSVCRQRDVKGLYARQAAGEIQNLTGVDGVYEPPTEPDVEIDTSSLDKSVCCDLLMAHLAKRGLC